jgi:hypothetical protein
MNIDLLIRTGNAVMSFALALFVSGYLMRLLSQALKAAGAG